MIHSRISWFIILLAAIAPQVTAAPPDSLLADDRSMGTVMAVDGLDLLRIAGHVFSAPVRWDGSDWLAAASIGAGTASSSVFDSDIRLSMQRNQSSTVSKINNITVEYGSGLNMLAASTAAYLAGLALKEDWLRETALLTGTTILVAGTLSTVTKVVVGRARPYLDQGHRTFKPFTFPTEDYASFPSGHTVVAFAVSGVLAQRISNVWASIGLYGLAAATAYSRLSTDQHWFSDVAFGAAVSIAVSRSVVQWYEGGKGEAAPAGFRLLPTSHGMMLVWIF